jgi:hypothetical protein
MAKASSKSTGGKFPSGGKNADVGRQYAGPKAPGVTGKVTTGNGGKFPMGGSGKMFGKGSARPAVAGRTAKDGQ